MRKFETMLLLSPELSADSREEIISSMIGIIEREGGQMLANDPWGMKDLAYPINKQTRGYYVRLEYSAPAALIAELERNIRITEGIFRFVSVRLEEEVEAENV